MASFPLNGKVAFVTGAARGIGFETARRLHTRGASVALVDLDIDATRDAAERIGDRTLALDADVADYGALELAANAVVERFGGIDVAVANAGIAPPARPVSALGPEVFERVIEVNLLGVWRTARAVLPEIIERRGHIVVTASIYAFFNGMMSSPYAMSKAGVEQLGRALRTELATHGASAGVAYFGFVDTEMVRTAFEDPLAVELEGTLPRKVTKRITPAQGASALVKGIERRAPRTIAPRWWTIFSVLRGITNPIIDARLERDTRIHDIVSRAERADRSADS